MKRTATVIAGLLLVGCTHTKTVGSGAEETKQASAATERRHSEHRASQPRRGEAAEEPRNERGEKEIPVATSPEGLLKPGAQERIEQRLADEGFLRRGDQPKSAARGETQPAASFDEALRRFQAHEHLPATGMPDQETVRKLGLDPDDVFKAGDVSPTDGDATKAR
jgi:murein L,D-transpeptidase YcbB/YkuD